MDGQQWHSLAVVEPAIASSSILCAAVGHSMMRLPFNTPVGKPTVVTRSSALLRPGTRHSFRRKVAGPLGGLRCLGLCAANVYGVVWALGGCKTLLVIKHPSLCSCITTAYCGHSGRKKLKTTLLSLTLNGGILLESWGSTSIRKDCALHRTCHRLSLGHLKPWHLSLQ